MKKLLILSLTAITLLSSCSKQSGDTTTPSTPDLPLTLVTKIIDNTPTDIAFGKSVAEFTWASKRLEQAITYTYASPVTAATTYNSTTTFNYDSQGRLSSTYITHSSPNPAYDDVKALVSYTGDYISQITFYKANNVPDRTVNLTYQNGLLTNYDDDSRVHIVYTYDANGNNTKEVDTEYRLSKPTGSQSTITNSTFDTNNNFTNSFPLWAYFQCVGINYMQTLAPGKNNPVGANDGNPFTYGYTYSSKGYPLTITYPGFYSYKYEYGQYKANY